jgi:hypothetical protein
VSSQLKIEGLAELRAALRALPTELVDEAGAIVGAAAEEAKRAIVDKYPTRTGNLKDGMSVTRRRSGNFGTAAVVVNKAKHAWIFESGTQARHNDIGANRGSMPPGHVFVPGVMSKRAEMYRNLGKMVEAHGLIVTGVDEV